VSFFDLPWYYGLTSCSLVGLVERDVVEIGGESLNCIYTSFLEVVWTDRLENFCSCVIFSEGIFLLSLPG
jgi:hypothetical protein